MRRWEYLSLTWSSRDHQSFGDWLNEWGSDGWEAYAHEVYRSTRSVADPTEEVAYHVTFKRRVPWRRVREAIGEAWRRLTVRTRHPGKRVMFE